LQKLVVRFDENAFNFLMRSGRIRLIFNNLKDAYLEFNLAQAIYPQDDFLHQILI
jgi:hypothetical protein